jgi:exoribonuclease-2
MEEMAEPGSLIEFLDGDRLQWGLVLEVRGSTLGVLTPTGKRLRVPERCLLLEHGRLGDPDLLAEKVRQLEERIRQQAEEIDLGLLWEAVRDGGDEQDLEALASVYFGAGASPVARSALLRRLWADAYYFSFNRHGLRFRPRTPEQVAALQEAEQRRRACAQRRQALQDVLRQALEEEEAELEPAVLEALEGLLRRGEPSEIGQLLEELAGRAGMTAREAAFEILVRAGRLEPSTEAYAWSAGLEAAFPEEVLAEARALNPFTPEEGREDFTDLAAFHIDDPETREVDDAFTLQPLPDGRWRVGVHLADPAYFFPPGTALDQEALRRALTIYLPTGPIWMLPERLGTDLASLRPGELRPTLSFLAEVDPGGGVRFRNLVLGQIRIQSSLSYEEADTLLEDTGAHPLKEALSVLYRAAEGLLRERLARGATVLLRPEYKVRVRGQEGEVVLKPVDPGSPARRLVSEWMIWANAMAARWALDHGVPMIYRAQDPPEDPDLQGQILAYDPLRWGQWTRLLRRTHLSTHPKAHAGLGLEAYVQISSPLRRYADLVLGRQLRAALRGEAPPYEGMALLEVLATAEAAESRMRALEARASRYWMLVWLSRQELTSYEAVVLGRHPLGYRVELRPYGLLGVLVEYALRQPGEVLPVRPLQIDPRRGLLRLEPA